MTSRSFTRPLAFAAAGLLSAALISDAAARDRKECERDYKPQVGQSGKDVVWVPTPDELVQRMLRMAKVTPQDLVFDLGAGDGKIAIAAGKLGANAVGIEYNPDMAKLASCLVTAEGVGNKVKIIQGDIFKEDFSKATVITMYLLPELNLCVRHRILGMKPGTRVTSHQFTMGDWEPDETSEFEYRTAYLWIVPARVDGQWVLREPGGASTTVNLTQNFQKLFAFNDATGATRTFNGTVRGNELVGTLKSGANEIKVTGTPQGALRAAAWAEMQPSCGRFYGK